MAGDRGAAVLWEPSAYKDANSERVNVCLEATEEALAEVARWEKAAVELAVKHGAAMFGKPLSQAQLQERFQSCLKTSAQGVTFLKLKATLPNVRFWDNEGKREAPSSLRGRKVLVAVQPRQLWVMNQQCGLLLELQDVKLDDGVEECPL
ncbi:pfh1 [Symbiodinium necroappetens]|uniref:Pfh1 protein n=1 Tax=Symbiodinium necroappetens TaxID=1628268 RepID=A0A813A7G2_9DINO|nr:pfh1 [Symbiodinium necroappetens]